MDIVVLAWTAFNLKDEFFFVTQRNCFCFADSVSVTIWFSQEIIKLQNNKKLLLGNNTSEMSDRSSQLDAVSKSCHNLLRIPLGENSIRRPITRGYASLSRMTASILIELAYSNYSGDVT